MATEIILFMHAIAIGLPCQCINVVSAAIVLGPVPDKHLTIRIAAALLCRMAKERVPDGTLFALDLLEQE
jgi:hypothetical protein